MITDGVATMQILSKRRQSKSLQRHKANGSFKKISLLIRLEKRQQSESTLLRPQTHYSNVILTGTLKQY